MDVTVTLTSCRDGDRAPPSSNTPQPDTVATFSRSGVNRDRVKKYRVNSGRVYSDRVNSDILTLPAYVLNMSHGRQAGATVGEKERGEARVSSEKSYCPIIRLLTGFIFAVRED